MRSDHPGALCISAVTKGEIVFSRPQRSNFPARSQASPTLGTIITKNSIPLCLSAAIGSPEGSPQAGRRDVLDASNSSKTCAEKKFASPIECKLWQ
jgi:hypothetical protein